LRFIRNVYQLSACQPEILISDKTQDGILARLFEEYVCKLVSPKQLQEMHQPG
jgi:hypothetical protein